MGIKSQSKGDKMNISGFRGLLLSAILIISGTGLASADAQLQRAQNLLDNGQFVEAELAYKNILIGKPHSIEANIGLATINAWNGDYRLAIFRYGNVLEQQPDHFQALVGLGYAQGWSGQLSPENHGDLPGMEELTRTSGPGPDAERETGSIACQDSCSQDATGGRGVGFRHDP